MLSDSTMILFNEPSIVKIDDYQVAIQKIVEKVSCIDGLIAIYQIGGIRHPGISDIDIVVITEDDSSCNIDFVKQLDKKSQYIFTHGLFVTTRTLFSISNNYTFFHNYKLLWGENIYDNKPLLSLAELKIIEGQWAKEYLTRMFINLAVEERFKIINIRNLLLRSKALIYDLEFLGVSPKTLCDCINLVMEWRDNWFSLRPQNEEIIMLHNNLHKSLVEFITQNFNHSPIFLPADGRNELRGKMKLNAGKTAKCTVNGLRLPWISRVVSRRGIAVRRRVNKFEFTIPATKEAIPQIIAESLSYTDNSVELVKSKFPFFVPLASNLTFE